VATATKALQDQLATRDLPRLAAALNAPFTFAVLKGRSNYLCRQRAAEVGAEGDQLSLDAGPGGPLGREVRRLLDWAETATVGDRADLPWEPSVAAWSAVSVGSTECPGATRCPSGPSCFAEAARRRAAQADVVVVNTHLYMAHLAARGELLPPHDVVIFDEAHELEDIASASLGFELTAGRLQALSRTGRTLLSDRASADAVDDAAVRLMDALRPDVGRRLASPPDPAVQALLIATRERLARLLADLRPKADEQDVDAQARRQRVLQAGTHVTSDLDQVLELPASKVAWVEGPDHAPVLRVAPIDVGTTLRPMLWEPPTDPPAAPTAILASATIPPGLATRLGLPDGSWNELDVGSPFAFETQALLYCPVHLPDPRQPTYESAMHDELVALVEAAGGRTLALFTSWKAMARAAEAVAARVPWPVLTQAQLPKALLVERFSTDEHSCLFATMGFWQGVDVPGSALSVVAIDRLPFPRPDDPLLQARRDRLGPAAFATIDVPRAATLLAQGAGRLIRNRTDRGVVAVLDSRLGRARYRWDLVRALPPMRRTRHRAEVEEFLAPLRAQ
jgi:ATP-dependent DNA helicase DinG